MGVVHSLPTRSPGAQLPSVPGCGPVLTSRPRPRRTAQPCSSHGLAARDRQVWRLCAEESGRKADKGGKSRVLRKSFYLRRREGEPSPLSPSPSRLQMGPVLNGAPGCVGSAFTARQTAQSLTPSRSGTRPLSLAGPSACGCGRGAQGGWRPRRAARWPQPFPTGTGCRHGPQGPPGSRSASRGCVLGTAVTVRLL